MNTQYPPALQPGDTIGIISTSCWVPEDDVLNAKTFMESQGYQVKIHPHVTNRLNQSAGTAIEKASALNDMFVDPEVKAIFGSRGGNRACTMLEHINFDLIHQNPKIIIGYSDLTILLNAIYATCGFTTFHGPLFRELPTHNNYTDMIDVLSGRKSDIAITDATVIHDGEAHGTLIGGNLSVFQGLIGTRYMPETKGAILMLEDVGDHISRYDRMFSHLKNTGILNNINGLIIGSFSDMKDSETNPFGFTLEDIVHEHTADLDIPIIMDAPFGHEDKLCTLPIGAPIDLKTDQISFKPLS